MGKVGRTIFGGPSQGKSESGNLAWDAVSGAMTPMLGYGQQGGDMIAKLLGGDPSGAQAFANSGGMKFLQDETNKQVTSNQAAKGLLKSGSTLTALQDRGHGLASTYLKDYMGSLFDFSKLGMGAANTMTGAGGWSKGKQEGEKKGALQTIAPIVGAFA